MPEDLSGKGWEDVKKFSQFYLSTKS